MYSDSGWFNSILLSLSWHAPRNRDVYDDRESFSQSPPKGGYQLRLALHSEAEGSQAVGEAGEVDGAQSAAHGFAELLEVA